MPDIHITISNLPQIQAAFRQAPVLMTRELNAAIKKAIMAIGGEAAKNSPMDTGRMRASILDPQQGLSFRNLYGQVGPATTYAIFVHEGTRFMRKRPFLLNAVQTKEQLVRKLFEDALGTVLRQIASKS